MMAVTEFVVQCALKGITLTVNPVTGAIGITPRSAATRNLLHYVCKYEVQVTAALRGEPIPPFPDAPPAGPVAPVEGEKVNSHLREFPRPAPGWRTVVPLANDPENPDEDPILAARLNLLPDLSQDGRWHTEGAAIDADLDKLIAEAVQAVYCAAVLQLLPTEPVTIANGTVITDPARWILNAYNRVRLQRARRGDKYFTSPYTNATVDNETLEQIALWYWFRHRELHGTDPDLASLISQVAAGAAAQKDL